MERWILATAAALATLMLVQESRTSYLSGSDLLQFCQDISNSGYGRCLGYIEGAVDSMEAARLSRHWPSCVPEGVDAAQVHNVVLKYLRDHPENRGQAASLLVVNAVSSAWNCSQTSQ